MFGKCKICIEKDQRIEELKEQISYFKKLLNPVAPVTRYELESDNIMNGGGVEQLAAPISEEHISEERKEAEAIQIEHDRILAGNYNQ